MFKLVAIFFGLVLTVSLLISCDYNAQQKMTAGQYPEYPSEPVKLYVTKCSVCHGAPLPKTYKVKVWPSILHRMQMRMVSKKVVPLSPQELAVILEYLQRNAE